VSGLLEINMPRDSSGNYTLPLGNPVADDTIIESTWANPTMSDIANQLNNVLTRDGLLGPTIAPFKILAGTVLVPGLAFNNALTTGIYYEATQMSVSWNGVKVGGFNASGFVGDVVGNVTGNVTGHASLDLPLTGGTLSGNLTAPLFLGNVTGHASLDLPLTGGTLSGNLTAPLFLGNVTGHASLDLPLTGGTLTGTLYIAPAASNAAIALREPLDSGLGAFFYFQNGGSTRWTINMISGAEGAGNTGADFSIQRYSNAGAALGNASLYIKRSDGSIICSGPYLTINSIGQSAVYTATAPAGYNAAASYCGNGRVPFSAGFDITNTVSGATQVNQRDANPIIFTVNGPEIFRVTTDAAYVAAGTLEVGYRKVPAISAPATLTRTESGKCSTVAGALLVTSAQSFQAGDTFTFNTSPSAGQTITFTGITCYIAGSATVKATVTLAVASLATLWFRTATECYISGSVS
jgi:hypothetical protein